MQRMTNRRPRSQRPDTRIAARNKKAILEAAIGVFTAKGYDGASIAEIAKQFGPAQGQRLLLLRLEGDDLPDDHRRPDRRVGPRARPARRPSASRPTRIAGYIRAKLDFSRKHAAQSRMFANEAVHGGRFITRKDRAHMLAVTLEKAKVFEPGRHRARWIRSTRSISSSCCGGPPSTMPISTCWRVTHWGNDRLTRAEYDIAAETLTGIVLKGCGVDERSSLRLAQGRSLRRFPQRVSRLSMSASPNKQTSTSAIRQVRFAP